MRMMNAAAFLIAAFLLSVAPARGQTAAAPGEFTAFAIPYLGESRGQYSPPSLLLESDAAGKTVFSMPHLVSVMNVSGVGGINSEYTLAIPVLPKAGYTITGFEFGGTMSGHLEISYPPPNAFYDRLATVDNTAVFGFYSWYPGLPEVDDLEGEQDFTRFMRAENAIQIHDGVAVELYGFMASYAEYTHYSWWEDGRLYDHKTSSFASIELTDAQFTVYWEIVPVPEPATWLMLVAGLLPFSLGVFRRRRAARPA